MTNLEKLCATTFDTSIDNLQRFERKYIKSDSVDYLYDIAIMGDTIRDVLDGTTSITNQIVSDAYSLAYPNMSQSFTLAESFNNLSGDALSLRGLISTLKGKIFEIQYVDFLNNGNLPLGYTALLATNPIQQGYDIIIHDNGGNISSLLQAKATTSIQYVKTALDRYPGIDIVVNEEMYNDLTQSLDTETVESIINSNISLKGIEDQIDGNFNVQDIDFPFLIVGIILVESIIGYFSGKTYGEIKSNMIKKGPKSILRYYTLYGIGNLVTKVGIPSIYVSPILLVSAIFINIIISRMNSNYELASVLDIAHINIDNVLYMIQQNKKIKELL